MYETFFEYMVNKIQRKAIRAAYADYHETHTEQPNPYKHSYWKTIWRDSYRSAISHYKRRDAGETNFLNRPDR